MWKDCRRSAVWTPEIFDVIPVHCWRRFSEDVGSLRRICRFFTRREDWSHKKKRLWNSPPLPSELSAGHNESHLHWSLEGMMLKIWFVLILPVISSKQSTPC
jgi:hypothetical protein